MKITKTKTETYALTGIAGRDPITVYVTNYEPGRGKIVIECYLTAWAYYWLEMGERTLQEFILACDNDYILDKLLYKTLQTDFDEINAIAKKQGFDINVTSDVAVTMASSVMDACFGPDWYRHLPSRNTDEYNDVSKILDAIKSAFRHELDEAKGVVR